MQIKYFQILAYVFTFLLFESVSIAAPPWWKAPTDPIGPIENVEIPPKTGPLSAAEKSSLPIGSPRNYLVLKGGIYSPQSDDLKEFDTGFNGEIAYGTYVNNNLIGELGVGYFKSEASNSTSILGLGSISSNLKASAYPITLSAKYAYPINIFEAFVAVGIGLYICEIKWSTSVTGFGSFSGSDDDTTFGFNVGLGGNVNISNNVFFGAEGKYIWVEPSFHGVDIRFDGYTTTFNVGYRF